MKKMLRRKIIHWYVLCLGLLLFCMSCYAKNDFANTTYNSDPLVTRMQIRRFKKPQGKIICMDIHLETGECLLGLENDGKAAVSVYDKTGRFLYAYSFIITGSFRVFWNDDNIGVWISRGDYVLVIDPQNDVYQLIDKSSFPTNIYEKPWFHNTSQRKVGNTEYRTQSQIGLLSKIIGFSTQLIILTPDGKSITAYDVNDEYKTETITMAVLVVVFVLCSIVIVARLLIKTIKNNRISVNWQNGD